MEGQAPPGAPAEAGGARGRSPEAGTFVGRTAELGLLDSLLERAIAGAGTLVPVVGESGIGKTALAREFLRRARARDDPPLTFFRGRCMERYGAGEAYLPFLDGLGSLLAGRGRERTAQILRTYAPTWCLHRAWWPRLLDRPDKGVPSIFDDLEQVLRQQTVGATRERMLREMCDVFEQAAGEHPIVLYLEDVQWADPSSVELLAYLGGRIARQRTLIVACLRDDNLQGVNPPLQRTLTDLKVLKHCQQISLGPVSREDVATYLDRCFTPHRFPNQLAGHVAQRTEGHPLFLASLIQFLQERGDIAREGEVWELRRPLSDADFPAPESVRAMIARKLESLSEEDRLALQYASVLGRTFLSTVLAALLEADELGLEERLARVARAHRIIEFVGEEELPGGALASRYRFAHTLYEEVLYEDLLTKRRQVLHKRAAEQIVALYGEEAALHQAALLALHFERGRDFPSAVAYSRQAGDNAARLCAFGEASGHYDHALGLVERLPSVGQGAERLVLYEKRGAIHHALGRFDLAARDYSLMLERARATGAAEPECAALFGLGTALFFGRRTEEMALVAHEGLCAAARSGLEAQSVAARLQVALLLQDDGELDDAEPLLEEVLTDARRLRLRPVLAGALLQRGALHYWRSEFVRAEARLKEALALAGERNDGFTALVSLMFVGASQVNQGRISESLRTTEEGIALAQRNGDRFWLPRLVSQKGWIHRELMAFEQARVLDGESLAIARGTQTFWAPEADALLNLFVDCAEAGREAEARQLEEELARAVSGRSFFRWFFEMRTKSARAQHWSRLGDAERAASHAQALLDAASGLRARTYVLTSRMVLAEVAMKRGDLAQAGLQLEQARLVLRESDCPLNAWRTHVATARLRALQGDAPSAAAAYRDADAIVKRIAASVEDAALRQTFLDSALVREVQAGAQAS